MVICRRLSGPCTPVFAVGRPHAAEIQPALGLRGVDVDSPARAVDQHGAPAMIVILRVKLPARQVLQDFGQFGVKLLFLGHVTARFVKVQSGLSRRSRC